MLQPNWKHGTQSSVNDEAAWVVTRSDILFRNPHVEVRDETVLIPGEDRPRRWTVVGRKKAIVVAAATVEGRFVLIHQARIPVQRWLWEFPAGQVDETYSPTHDHLQNLVSLHPPRDSGSPA